MVESSGRHFFCKGPDGNILGLAGRVVSEATSSAVVTQKQPATGVFFLPITCGNGGDTLSYIAFWCTM